MAGKRTLSMRSPFEDRLQRQFQEFLSNDDALSHSNQFKATVTFVGAVTSSGELLSWRSCLFRTFTSSRSETSTDQLLLVNRQLFRELVFQNSYFLGRQICSEYQYLQNSIIFEAGTSTKHQIFFEEKMTLSKKIKHKIASLDRDL